MYLPSGGSKRWFCGGAVFFAHGSSQCESHGAGDLQPAVQRRFTFFARHRMKSIFRRLSRFVSQGIAGGSVIALTCAISPGAQAQMLGPLVTVAAGDPFSGCTADQVHAQESAFGSALYPATSIDPWVAA